MTTAQERPAGLDRLLTTEELAEYCHVPVPGRFTERSPRFQ
jgi:hypothetical protein